MRAFARYIPLLEKIALAMLAIGIGLTLLGLDISLLKFSIFVTAILFFISAYVPIDIPRVDDGEVGGLRELLTYLVAPKVAFIGSAVILFGIGLYLANPSNEIGFKKMLLIGMTTTGVASLIILAGFVTGAKYTKYVMPVLYRAIPSIVAAAAIWSKVN